MVPSAVSFSRMGTTVFSVSSEYPAQFARGTWNWLTKVYTVGVASICENAIGELTMAIATNAKPTATPIICLFMHLSLGWPGQPRSATRRKVVPRRSLAASRMVRGYVLSSGGNLRYIGPAPTAPASVRRQYSLTLSLSTQFRHATCPRFLCVSTRTDPCRGRPLHASDTWRRASTVLSYRYHHGTRQLQLPRSSSRCFATRLLVSIFSFRRRPAAHHPLRAQSGSRAGVQPHKPRWKAGYAGRLQRQSDPSEFLGNLVRTVPRRNSRPC